VFRRRFEGGHDDASLRYLRTVESMEIAGPKLEQLSAMSLFLQVCYAVLSFSHREIAH
jgi:hypothetical protein